LEVDFQSLKSKLSFEDKTSIGLLTKEFIPNGGSVGVLPKQSPYFLVQK